MKKKILIGAAVSIPLILMGTMISCSSIPKNATPIDNFEVKKYMGLWYEIARIDFTFEKNMNNTTAQYDLDQKGFVNVLNSGYNYKKDKWSSASGKAKFRGDENIAALKVSFFGPFYSGYNVIALDSDYKYALVAGKDLDLLWILSREKSIPEDVKQNYLKIARGIGYDTSRLIWVEHDRSDNPYINER